MIIIALKYGYQSSRTRSNILKDAIDEGNLLVVSLDRLLFMRVCAMEVEKYKKDLFMMKEYYYEHFRNQEFLHEAETHITSYDKSGGIIFGGKYIDERKCNYGYIKKDII